MRNQSTLCSTLSEVTSANNNWKRFTFTTTTGNPLTSTGTSSTTGTQNNGAGGISNVILTANPWPWRAPTKTPEVPAGVETTGSMIVLAAKASPYTELDPGT